MSQSAASDIKRDERNSTMVTSLSPTKFPPHWTEGIIDPWP
jgi:hypothetical protein